MATARKVTVDPLTEELPDEPKPEKASEVKFEIQIAPYVVSGTTYFRWTVLSNNKKSYAGDYAGHTESGFRTAADAEDSAAGYVERIRQAVDQKLNAPDAYVLVL